MGRLLCIFFMWAHVGWSAPLRVDQEGFLDERGRRVLLRGVNVAGHAKVPPFRHNLEIDDYKRLRGWGVNVVRLLWIWEAFEPQRGVYQFEYLDDVRKQIQFAHLAGIKVILDIHQDGFSRFLIGGCGDGFPQWAISVRVKLVTPNNAERCQSWGARMAFDQGMHQSWKDFYGNVDGMRSQFMKMLALVASRLKVEPNLLGYDLLNEPWGTPYELKTLWEDSAKAIREDHHDALIFVSPHALTSTGIPFKHQIPNIRQAVYSPHFYDPLVIATKHYLRRSLVPTLKRLHAEARSWGMPLFLGEFGFSPHIGRGRALRRDFYGALDRTFTSATQWNYTPLWTPDQKDGWNLEDFSIVDHTGMLRSNFSPRPYPQVTAGDPLSLVVREGPNVGSMSFVYQWVNDPRKGATEIYLGSRRSIKVKVTDGLRCIGDDLLLSCSSQRRGIVQIEVEILKG